MKKILPLPPFLPDQSANSGVLLEADGVYPRVDGYGPLRAFQAQSETLGAAFAGGASFISTDGTSYMLAGTATGLVRYASGSWSDLLTGMTIPGRWRFVQFGDYVVAVNGVATEAVDLDAGTAAAISGSPAGIAVAVVGDYVVIAQGDDALLNIYTSGFNDHTDWNTAGSGGATIQPMLTGGEVMGLGGGEYGVILQRQRIVRMSRTGDATAPFQYDEITSNIGCASKASVIQVGRSIFFLSDRGFMALEDGQTVRPLGSEKVDRTFQSRVDRDDFERIYAAVDPQNKLVIWVVPGSPGTIWFYNFELDRWSTATVVIDGLFSGFTSSLTLEALAVTYTDLDAMTYSLDDPRFAGGSPRLYAVSGGKLGTFTADTIKASFQYGFNEFSPGRVSRVRNVRPITDAIAGNSVSIAVNSRMGDVPMVKNAGVLRDSGAMPVRASGRYHKLRWEIAAGSLWSYAQGLEIEMDADGGR